MNKTGKFNCLFLYVPESLQKVLSFGAILNTIEVKFYAESGTA